MNVRKFIELQTHSSKDHPEEIATLIVNMGRGLILREIFTDKGKIYFVLEEPNA